MTPRQYSTNDGDNNKNNNDRTFVHHDTTSGLPHPVAHPMAAVPTSPAMTRKFNSKAIKQNTSTNDNNRFDWWNEIRLFLELAIPFIFFSIGLMISPFLTASIVGRKFGATHLSGFTLANLTGNLCTFSILAGMFSASDTLSPQAYGMKNYRELGLIAIRGVLACAAILIPINIVLVLYLKDILVSLGQDEEASGLAQEWYRIFALALPFFVIFYSAQKFLSAQNCMKPLIIVTAISSGIILPVSLEYLTESAGFLGSAMAYVVYQASQVTLLFLYLAWKKPHVEETWPGLGAWKEAIERQKIMEFMHLGAGGIFAQSEWIYWEALGIIIGCMGVVPLTAHAIPNNIIMTTAQVPFAAGVALTVRLGVKLSESVSHAKKIAIFAILMMIVLYGFISILLYFYSDMVFSIFTTDEEVIALAHAIWWKVCTYNFVVSIFAILSGVAIALGMQWIMGAVNFFFLWMVGIPITSYSALWLGEGLEAAWTWINAPYVGINLCLLVIIFAMTDWNAVKEKILEQNEATSPSLELQVEDSNMLSCAEKGSNESAPLLLRKGNENVVGYVMT